MSGVRTGGQILVDQLLVHGTKHVFGVPGESYLPVLDAIYDRRDQLSYFACRQEGGAAMMAEADGKLTGSPGVCIVTRGPGATNASLGVHIAQQDSTAMILLVGQVPRHFIGREAFQEVDIAAVFGPLSKWAAQIDAAAEIPEMLKRAFRIATSGRPGPVVLALPEDMLREESAVPDAVPFQRVSAIPAATDIAELHRMLAAAKKPLAIVGGGGWNAAAADDIQLFAEHAGIPLAASFRRQDYFSNAHRLYAGDLGLGINTKLAQRLRDADLLLVLGARLGELPTGGYTLIEAPLPKQQLIHVHADADELGRVYQPTLGIHADAHSMASALAILPPVDANRWSQWAQEARADYAAHILPAAVPGELQLGQIIARLREMLPDDAIVTNGAGNYTAWVHRYFQYRQFGTQLAPVAGSMGYGVPAAIAAKLRHPGRQVVCFAGDGCFLMNGQEFATAGQYGANVVFIVINNGMFGTIRMHQERNYPGRVSHTELVNPDFAAYAGAFGGYGEVVAHTEDFPQAFRRAMQSRKPALLELRVDPEALTPGQSLSEIRETTAARAE